MRNLKKIILILVCVFTVSIVMNCKTNEAKNDETKQTEQTDTEKTTEEATE